MNTENHHLIDSSMPGLIRASLGLTVVTLILCGFLYSAVATGLGQLIFPYQANGSMMIKNNQIVGSALVAQPFAQAQYFHPRPSASKYDPMIMAGSNLARTNPELNKIIDERLNEVGLQEQTEKSKIPADLVTASGSGIDPEISVQAALIQVKRIAKARNLSEQSVQKIIQQQTIQPSFGIIGKPRLNVLKLNLTLDQIDK